MEAPFSRARIASEAQSASQSVLSCVQNKLSDSQVGQVRKQQEVFLEQVRELQRISDIQESTAQVWKAHAEEDSPKRGKGSGDCLGLSQEVVNRLNDYFSVTDTVSTHEAGILGAQLGISAETVRTFLHQSQAHVQQVLEAARLKFLISSKISKPKRDVPQETPMQPASHAVVGCDEMHGISEVTPVPWGMHQGFSIVKTDHGNPDTQSKVGSSSDGGKVGSKRTRPRLSEISATDTEAGSGGSAIQQGPSPEDTEKIGRLNGLKSRTGGLLDTGSAGSMLLVMREESSFSVREALLKIILQTDNEVLLERLVGGNLMFCSIMENWMLEGTKQKKTQFLKQMVAALEHLPLKTEHIKNSRLQTLATRLANKYQDQVLRISASELVNRFQNLRQGLSPGGQGKGHRLGTVLERLQSGEAKQKGKVFFLPGDELKRPVKKKSALKQRPLTTSEIVERQQRQRYLSRAGVSPDMHGWRSAEDSPDAGQGSMPGGAHMSIPDHNDMVQDTLEALHKHQDEKKWKQESSKPKPKPSRAPASSATASGTLVRWMREPPSDPSFYSFQQHIYQSARVSRIAEEQRSAKQDARKVGRMRAVARWVRPPPVQFTCNSLALGEASMESQSLAAQERPIRHGSQLVRDTPQEPLPVQTIDAPDPQVLPFAPLNQEEQEDQRRKLLAKGVRKQEFVQITVSSSPHHPQAIQTQQTGIQHRMNLQMQQLPPVLHQVPGHVIGGHFPPQIAVGLGSVQNPSPIVQTPQGIRGQVVQQQSDGKLSGQHASQGWTRMGNRW